MIRPFLEAVPIAEVVIHMLVEQDFRMKRRAADGAGYSIRQFYPLVFLRM